MISMFVVVLSLLGMGIFLYQQQARKHKRELFLMKRHAATYLEQHKRL